METNKGKIFLSILHCDICNITGTCEGLEKRYFINCPRCDCKLTPLYYEDKIEEEKSRINREKLQKIIDENYKNGKE